MNEKRSIELITPFYNLGSATAHFNLLLRNIRKRTQTFQPGYR